MERFDNNYLLDLYNSGYKLVSRLQLYDKEKRTIEDIQRVSDRYNRICAGYSSGKDCIVVVSLLEKAKVDFVPALWQTCYQFPKNQEWIEHNGPNGLVRMSISRPSWEDIESDDRLLFTADKKADNFYMGFKWREQQKFLTQNKFDLFVTGRRLAESNNCGRKSDGYVRRGKYDTFSPIAEWSVQEVLAYIRYNGFEVPWQYLNTANGFSFGSVAWTERRRFGFKASIEQRWHEVFDADKSVVEEAASHLTSAREFLERVDRTWAVQRKT